MSRWLSLKETFLDTVRRFPLSVAASALYTVIIVLAFADILKPEGEEAVNRLISCLYVLGLGCFWFVSLQLVKESRGVLPPWIYLVWAGLLASVGAYIYNGIHLPFAHLLLAVSPILLMFVAPYLYVRNDSLATWAFVYRFALRIGLTVLAAITLYAGLSAVVASLDYLLGIKFSKSGNIYVYFWLIVASFFSPLFAMAGIPKTFTEHEGPYPKFLRILVCNLMVPLWFAYAAVLYAYIIKILLTWTLPKGGVAILTSLFAVKGVLLYLAVYPLYLRGESLALWLGRHGPKLLIAPLVLLAVAIGTRIRENGVTPDRYAILLCLVWLIAFCIHWLRKAENPLRFAILSAVALLFLASFGPWGMEGVSTCSQFARLEAVLKKNNMLSQGKLVAPVQKPSFADRKTISSIVDYLVEAHRVEKIRSWFSGKDQNAIITPGLLSADADSDPKAQNRRITEAMGIAYVWPYYYQDDTESEPEEGIRYNWPWEKPFGIEGFDYAVRLETKKSRICLSSGECLSAEFSQDNWNTLTLKNEQGTLTFDLASLFIKGALQKKDRVLVIDKENDRIKARLVLISAYGRFDNVGLVLTAVEAMLLVRVK